MKIYDAEKDKIAAMEFIELMEKHKGMGIKYMKHNHQNTEDFVSMIHLVSKNINELLQGTEFEYHLSKELVDNGDHYLYKVWHRELYPLDTNNKAKHLLQRL